MANMTNFFRAFAAHASRRRAGARTRLSQVLQRGEVRDDLIERTVISISEVRMSPDLKIATAFVTPLGVADHQTRHRSAQSQCQIHPRPVSGRSFEQMKYMPEVRFRDRHQLRQLCQKIDALLRSPEVQRDLEDGDDGGTDKDR